MLAVITHLFHYKMDDTRGFKVYKMENFCVFIAKELKIMSVSKDTLSDTLSQITSVSFSLENTNVSVHKKCLYNQVVEDNFFFCKSNKATKGETKTHSCANP